MVTSSKLLGLCALLGAAYVYADCPNSCSGHGSCGDNNRCLCYANWQNADCSERTCPYGTSWSTGSYAECSDKGSCDRKNGQCKCDDGYGGQDCSRTVCKNGCSGHGSCLPSSANAAMYYCSCDGGFTGTDCSSRLCPVGDDPMTKETYIGNSGQLQGDETQRVTVTGTSKITGSFTLTYTDKYGGSWTTRPMSIYSDSADHSQELEDLLEKLPNQVIPDVTVTSQTSSATVNAYDIAFLHSANSGDQNLLSCNIAGCDLDGCQPRFTGMKKATELSVAHSTTAETFRFINSQVAITTSAVDGATNGITMTANSLTITAGGKTAGDHAKLLGLLDIGDTFQIEVGGTVQTGYGVMTVTSIAKTATTPNVGFSHVGGGSTTDLTAAATKLIITKRSNTIMLYGADTFTTATNSFASLAVGDKISFSGTNHNDKTFTVSEAISGAKSIRVSGEAVVDETQVSGATIVATQETAQSSHSCTVVEQVKGTKEAEVCSSRGVCDSSTGLCSCFSGYTGENCDSQNAQI